MSYTMGARLRRAAFRFFARLRRAFSFIFALWRACGAPFPLTLFISPLVRLRRTISLYVFLCDTLILHVHKCT